MFVYNLHKHNLYKPKMPEEECMSFTAISPYHSQVPIYVPEILEIIFSHLDGKSLARCGQVSKLWKHTLEELTVHSNIWKKCCENEIERNVRTDILNKSQPTWYRTELSNKEWRNVYRDWCAWHRVKYWSYLTYVKKEWCPKVTCLKVSGSCAVTGHSSGFVCLWDDFDKVLLIETDGDIKDISLMVCRENCDLQKDIRDKSLKHQFVVSVSERETILIAPLTFSDQIPSNSFPISVHHLYIPRSVSSHHDMFAIESSRWISIWKLKSHPETRAVNAVECFRIQIVPPGHLVSKLWAIENTIKVSSITYNGVYLPPSYAHKESVIPDECRYGIFREQVNAWKSIRGRIVKVFYFRNGVTFVTTDDHFLYASICGSIPVKYNTVPQLHSYPVTVVLHGEVLLLGMDSGSIYMYVLENTSDLLNLNLKSYEWKSTPFSRPVMALDVVESDTGPRIFAAYRDDEKNHSEYIVSIIFRPPWVHETQCIL